MNNNLTIRHHHAPDVKIREADVSYSYRNRKACRIAVSLFLFDNLNLIEYA